MGLPDRVRLVVLFGGRSAEHDVSCTTAVHVLRAVDPTRYSIVPVGITREGAWLQSDETMRALESGELSQLPAQLSASTGTAIEPMPTVAPALGDDVPTVV